MNGKGLFPGVLYYYTLLLLVGEREGGTGVALGYSVAHSVVRWSVCWPLNSGWAEQRGPACRTGDVALLRGAAGCPGHVPLRVQRPAPDRGGLLSGACSRPRVPDRRLSSPTFLAPR